MIPADIKLTWKVNTVYFMLQLPEQRITVLGAVSIALIPVPAKL